MPRSVVTGRSIDEIAAGKGKKRVWHSNRGEDDASEKARPQTQSAFKQQLKSLGEIAGKAKSEVERHSKAFAAASREGKTESEGRCGSGGAENERAAAARGRENIPRPPARLRPADARHVARDRSERRELVP